MQRKDHEIHRRAGMAAGRKRRIERPAAAEAVAPGSPSTNSDISSSVNEAGSSQNEMLFMRGNAMSGAPIMSGTNQLPKPPISAGMTMKKIMIRPCAVVNTLIVSCERREDLHAGLLQFQPHADRERAADHAAR